MIIGAVLALIFIGLPLGIVWLFVASILDRRNTRDVDGHHESKIGKPALVQRSGAQTDGAAPPLRAQGEIHSSSSRRPARAVVQQGRMAARGELKPRAGLIE
jgi:hypothetical protein